MVEHPICHSARGQSPTVCVSVHFEKNAQVTAKLAEESFSLPLCATSGAFLLPPSAGEVPPTGGDRGLSLSFQPNYPLITSLTFRASEASRGILKRFDRNSTFSLLR